MFCPFNFLSQPLTKVSTMTPSNQESSSLLYRLLSVPRKVRHRCSGGDADSPPEPLLSAAFPPASPSLCREQHGRSHSLLCCQPSPHLITSSFILSRSLVSPFTGENRSSHLPAPGTPLVPSSDSARGRWLQPLPQLPLPPQELCSVGASSLSCVFSVSFSCLFPISKQGYQQQKQPIFIVYSGSGTIQALTSCTLFHAQNSA